MGQEVQAQTEPSYPRELAVQHQQGRLQSLPRISQLLGLIDHW
jgi:hypothetical protein